MRVYIQHAECLTALGNTKTTCQALASGSIALKPMPVPHVEGEDLVPQAWMEDAFIEDSPRWLGHLQTLCDGLPNRPWGSTDYPIFITSSNYGIDRLFEYSQSDSTGALEWGTPHAVVEALRHRFGWGDRIMVLSHACVTGQLGLIQAERAVTGGEAKETLVFSFDFLSPFVIGGFHSLKILNAGMPAPYHAGEIGSIGLGEGAAAVVLGTKPSAFRIEGQSLYNEMYHFTANAPDGSGFNKIFQSMAEMVEGRKVWVKGHGTGTLEAGRLEAESIDRLLPDAPLVSWKGSLGHTLGSCAVVELCITLEAIRAGRIPGNVGAKAPFFSESVAAESFSAKDYHGVVLSSNAFGGAHAAMFLSHE